MKLFLSLLLCFSASAQLPVVPYVLPNSGPQPPSSGLTIWLKPETISQLDNTTIATWPDSSGNNHNFTSNTTTKWTNNVIKTYGGVYCNGTGYLVGTNSSGVVQNVAGESLFIVTKILTPAAFSVLATHYAGTAFQRCSFTTTAGSKLSWQGRTLDADSVLTVGAVANNPIGYFLAECVVSNSTGRIWWYTNNVLVGNSASLTAANTSNTAGSADPTWGQMDGSSAKTVCVEYLYYARPVSDSERTNSIEPYFLNKYGPW